MTVENPAGAQATTEAPAATEKPAAAGTPAATDAAAAAAAAAATDDKGAAPAKPVAGDEGKTPEPATPKPDDKAAAAAAAAKVVPEKYELKVPEAGAAHVDAADVAEIEKLARASGWSNDEAQAALEEYVGNLDATAQRFLAETRADKEYGGEHLAETQQLARRVIDHVRPEGHARREAFLRFINRGGAGNHVEVLAFLADLGKQMGEDSPAAARSTGTRPASDAASKLYDNPASKKIDASS